MIFSETASGLRVDLENPQASSINIQDVAASLSKLCRFTGHTLRFYSVAEHSIFVAEEVKRRGGKVGEQMAGLLHDAPEMITNDISRPAKGLICGSGMAKLVKQLDDIIYPMFGATWTPLVKECDNVLCITEARALMPSAGLNWPGDWPAPSPWIQDEIELRTTYRDAFGNWELWRFVRTAFLDKFLALEKEMRG